MIEKFVSIKNIGCFRSCIPSGDVTLRRFSLIFAENGRGKTTLCAVLRSLQSGDSALISERKRLGATGLPTALIRLGGSNFAFDNGAWSATHPDIRIFDSVFVHENVYAGDYVNHEHKKNLYCVIVGEPGVRLARQIGELDAGTRKASADISNASAALEGFLPSNTTIDAYLGWEAVDGVDNKIEQNTAQVTKRQRAAEKAAEIKAKSLLGKLELPSLPTEFLTILAKQLEDLAEDAEQRVRQQVADHRMGSQGEAWLAQGLGFVASDKCPFCGQGTDGNELLTAYRSHFNAAYSELKQEVARLAQRVTNAIGDAAMHRVQQSLSSNLTLIEFWKQFCNVAVEPVEFAEIQVIYSTLRQRALALAQRKEQSPIESVTPGADFERAIGDVETIQQSVAKYNEAIDVANAAINQQKFDAEQGQDVATLKAALEDLKAKKQRFTPEAIKACEDYQNAVASKKQLEDQKELAKQQLDRHCEQVVQPYEASINNYLDQFNAGFRITNSRHSYAGGTPSSHFQITINDNAIDLGDSRTQPGTPCFKTTLSSGDRSSLALAFFLASLKHDHNIADKIVVLDDPFTSQDRFRRTCTQQLIWQLAKNAKQVILLSHDVGFLRLAWDGYAPAEVKVLQLMVRANNTTMIAEWDIAAETQSTHMKNYGALLGYYREQSGTPLDVARSIRPFIEGLLRSHFPGQFLPDEWLGDFISKIRDAQTGDGLEHAKADLAELQAINDYSKKYHHDQNPNADAEALSPDELHGFVKRTLRLVGGV